MTKTVALLGAFDTKGVEYAHLAELLRGLGVEVLLVDTSVIGDPPVHVDVTAHEVAEAGGSSLLRLRESRDRGAALEVMAVGAASLLADLQSNGRIHGAMGLGGTGGTSVASAAFRPLPLGMPKIVVSTAASGNTQSYIGESDLILIPSVTDVAGLNPLLRHILRNAAAAMAGMLKAPAEQETGATGPTIAASMFGVTTPCVDEARRLLDLEGAETLVFHMTGIGGRTLEHLISNGWIDGVLDVTTTELADELVGGVFNAGSARLTSAAAKGVPQVVSLGALDMVNFGAFDTVPPKFANRNLYRHNASVTLMRTTPQECAELGARLAKRVAASTGPATVFVPLRGISAIAVQGGPFWDPDADQALFDAVRTGLAGSSVELIELDTHINDPAFAAAMVDRLLQYLGRR